MRWEDDNNNVQDVGDVYDLCKQTRIELEWKVERSYVTNQNI